MMPALPGPCCPPRQPLYMLTSARPVVGRSLSYLAVGCAPARSPVVSALCKQMDLCNGHWRWWRCTRRAHLWHHPWPGCAGHSHGRQTRPRDGPPQAYLAAACLHYLCLRSCFQCDLAGL